MVKLVGEKVMLRDFIPSDKYDHVEWRTVLTDWQKWDCPWDDTRDIASVDEYVERRVSRLKRISDDDIRWTFELCTYPEEKHVGWMNCYCIDVFGNYATKDTGRYCLGIDIVPCEERGKGLGAEAFKLYQNYLFEFGVKKIYTQTWSGNTRMIALAEKLGYEVYKVKKNFYVEDGVSFSRITFVLKMADELAF